MTEKPEGDGRARNLDVTGGKDVPLDYSFLVAIDLKTNKKVSELRIESNHVEAFAGKLPILGVCLGHQAIGEAFGGNVIRAKQVMHGKTSLIAHTGVGVFKDLPSPFTVIRYHSLAIERESCPEALEVTAWTEDGEIMGVRHRSLAIEGVQFHPESILTHHGHALLSNFLKG